MPETAAPTARTLSALATKATGVAFTAKRVTGRSYDFQLALTCYSGLDGAARVAAARAAIAATGLTTHLVADGWKIAVTA